ncbi:hypothetical protein AVEN_36296-1 [Araneus ventricosus]|uniref:Uncharacterized protein n=1 Tax=Araneus ventricosus TaxID=182803 RepID=A0A4Y2NZU3_ARAVE|nr:hypothetical protein AVEN_36296-1 [Araneus ventricosus]
MMSHIVLFATVLPKLDSLSAMRIREREEINNDVLIDDFLSLDSEAETWKTLIELDILDSVKNENNAAMNCVEDDKDGNDHGAEINKPSYDEMLKSFETIRRGLQFEENTPEGAFVHCKDARRIMRENTFSNKKLRQN